MPENILERLDEQAMMIEELKAKVDANTAAIAGTQPPTPGGLGACCFPAGVDVVAPYFVTPDRIVGAGDCFDDITEDVCKDPDKGGSTAAIWNEGLACSMVFNGNICT